MGGQVFLQSDQEQSDGAGAEAEGNKELMKATQLRQRLWLGRSNNGKRSTWRPRKLHRVSAKHWLINVDNAIKLTTTLNGLAHFVLPPEEKRNGVWADWRTWPFLAISMDMGSDGVSAVHALLYMWMVCCDLVPDWSHGLSRSVFQTLKKCNLYSLMLLGVISWNVPFGPDKEDQRFLQIKGHMAWVFENCQPTDLLLFQALLPRILGCMRRLGY